MISNIQIVSAEESKYIKPMRMVYEQDGVVKQWDIVSVHDSVAILLYHYERECLIVVKQFRPPVYLKNNDGFTYELCAGIVDKNKSLVEIAQEEILEECGYDVPLDKIEKITSFYTAVGFAGSHQTLYYAQIDESMHVGVGGGVDIESIEVIEIPLEEVHKFALDETKAKTPGFLFACTWFLAKRVKSASR